MDELTKSGFDIAEPTEEEIKKIIQKVQDQDNITLSEDDAIKYTKLYEELKQWFLLEKNLESPDSIAEEVAEEIKDNLKNSQDLEIGQGQDQAQDIAEKSLSEIIPREKERIGKELKAIIAKYK